MTVRHVRVGDVLRLERTRITPDPAVTYRQIGVYSWGKGIIENEAITGAELSKVTYHRFPPDALILSNIQAWEAAIAVSTERHADEFIASQRFLPYVPIRPQEVDTSYLLHFFLSDQGMVLIRKASPGTVTRNRTLGISAFENLVIPLPSYDAQRDIAARVGRLTGFRKTVERGNVDARRVIGALSRQIVESTTSAVAVAQLGSVVELVRRSVDIAPGDTYFEIGVRSFGRGLFHKEAVSGASLGDKRVFAVREGDLVVSNIFAWEGAVAVATPKEARRIGSHRFMTWVVDPERADVKYLYYYLTSGRGVAQLLQASPGSAGRNKTLAIQAFRDLEVPLPDLHAQRAMAARLDDLADLMELEERRQVLVTALPQAARNEMFSTLV